jgi:hypothetical protein
MFTSMKPFALTSGSKSSVPPPSSGSAARLSTRIAEEPPPHPPNSPVGSGVGNTDGPDHGPKERAHAIELAYDVVDGVTNESSTPSESGPQQRGVRREIV